MSVYAEFFEHKDFGGSSESFYLNNSYRYWWIKFGSTFGNRISSFRGHAANGFNGNLFTMSQNNFSGKLISLNMSEGSTSWWNWVGSNYNDDIESALLVNRNKNEMLIELKTLILSDFISGLDDATSGTPVSRKGDPVVYTTFWPSFASDRNFVSIEQNLNVAIDWWPDYDAQVRYDIYLYLNGNGNVWGYSYYPYVWVEGGIFSRKIFNELYPKLKEGATTLTQKIQRKLSLLSFKKFNGLYLLPGNKPSANFGDYGDTRYNSTLVLVE